MRTELNGDDTKPMAASQILSADDIGMMIVLLRELRELTQSRASFAAANELLARFDPTDEDVTPELVHDGAFAH